MKVNIIYDDKTPIGWEFCPTTNEERVVASKIRDLQFFGFGETARGN